MTEHSGKKQPETKDYGVSWEKPTSINGIGTLNSPKAEEEDNSNLF